jgi:hypothetical protein
MHATHHGAPRGHARARCRGRMSASAQQSTVVPGGVAVEAAGGNTAAVRQERVGGVKAEVRETAATGDGRRTSASDTRRARPFGRRQKPLTCPRMSGAAVTQVWVRDRDGPERDSVASGTGVTSTRTAAAVQAPTWPGRPSTWSSPVLHPPEISIATQACRQVVPAKEDHPPRFRPRQRRPKTNALTARAGEPSAVGVRNVVAHRHV